MSERGLTINDAFALMLQILEQIRLNETLGSTQDKQRPDIETLSQRVKLLQAQALELAATVRHCGIEALEAQCSLLRDLRNPEPHAEALLADWKNQVPHDFVDFKAWFNSWGPINKDLAGRLWSFGRDLQEDLSDCLRNYLRHLDALSAIHGFRESYPRLIESHHWAQEAWHRIGQTSDLRAMLADHERVRSELLSLEVLQSRVEHGESIKTDNLLKELRQLSPERLRQKDLALVNEFLEQQDPRLYREPEERLHHMCMLNLELEKFLIRIKARDDRCERIATRLNDLRAFDNGWLDGRGLALSAPGLDWLETCLFSNYPDDLRLPYLYPTAEGGVQAEWSFGAFEISLEINLDRHTGEWHLLNTETQADDWKDLDLAESSAWSFVAIKIQQAQALIGERP